MDLHQSLHHILECRNGSFGEMFYARFLSDCPEALPFFEHVDLRLQATILTNSLHIVVAQSTNNYAVTSDYLRILGHRHQGREIPGHLLPRFSQAMLSTLREYHGEAWNESLECQWRSALDMAVETMRQGYVSGPLTY